MMDTPTQQRDWFSTIRTYFCHLVGGLTLGMVLCALHISLVAANSSGMPKSTLDSTLGYSLWWPVVGVIYGLIQARVAPLKWLRNMWVQLAMVLISIVAFLYSAFMLILATFAGYC